MASGIREPFRSAWGIERAGAQVRRREGEGMAKNHGARQQKKVAKQKAKRAEKRSDLIRRTSSDPAVRLHQVEKWPVVQALVGANLWKTGMGQLVLARKESEGSY